MAFKDDLLLSGNRLFTLRSYLPLLLLALCLIVMSDIRYPYGSHFWHTIWELFCLSIALFGLLIRILTVGFVPRGTSGRKTRMPRADILNTTGMYSIVRHPIYSGNLFILCGVSMFPRLWWFTVLSVCLFALYYERIIYMEEKYLEKLFGEKFLEWADKTPAIVPKPRLWKRPVLSFSFRSVLTREYHGFFGIIVLFTILEIMGDFYIYNHFVIDLLWLSIFIFALIVYIVVRILRKTTRLLEVEGR